MKQISQYDKNCKGVYVLTSVMQVCSQVEKKEGRNNIIAENILA